MKYRIQVYYPGSGAFMNTNHESDDLATLKRVANSDKFLGFRVRILDDSDSLRFAPPLRERKGEPSLSDIAAALDVPILPPLFMSPDDSEDEDEDDGKR
jgi:hypothetical protein